MTDGKAERSEVALELARIRRSVEPPARLTERIVAALRAGEGTSSALAARLGVPQGGVQDALGKLGGGAWRSGASGRGRRRSTGWRRPGGRGGDHDDRRRDV